MLVPALFMGVWITIANGLEMQQTLRSAEAIGQVMGVREVAGKYQMTMAAILSLVLASISKSRWLTSLLLSIVAITVGGIILAKFRSVWVAGLLGVVLVWFALQNIKARKRMIWHTILGGGLLFLIVFTLFQDVVQFIFLGVTDRFTTLGDPTGDLSLRLRWAEYEAAFRKTLINPVIGYGWGVPFSFHNIAHYATLEKSFVHNTYLSALYRHGLFGLAILVYIWVATALKSFFVARQNYVPETRGALSAALLGLLIIFALTAMTSDPFMSMDQILVMILVFALVEGIWQRNNTLTHAS